MVKFLFNRIAVSNWLDTSPSATSDHECYGVLLRKSRGSYITAPSSVQPSLVTAVKKLNAQVAFTMRTESINIILDALNDSQTELLMKDGSQLQVLNSLQDISNTNIKRFQYCCLLRQESMVLVW